MPIYVYRCPVCGCEALGRPTDEAHRPRGEDGKPTPAFRCTRCDRTLQELPEPVRRYC